MEGETVKVIARWSRQMPPGVGPPAFAAGVVRAMSGLMIEAFARDRPGRDDPPGAIPPAMRPERREFDVPTKRARLRKGMPR